MVPSVNHAVRGTQFLSAKCEVVIVEKREVSDGLRLLYGITFHSDYKKITPVSRNTAWMNSRKCYATAAMLMR